MDISSFLSLMDTICRLLSVDKKDKCINIYAKYSERTKDEFSSKKDRPKKIKFKRFHHINTSQILK